MNNKKNQKKMNSEKTQNLTSIIYALGGALLISCIAWKLKINQLSILPLVAVNAYFAETITTSIINFFKRK